MTRILHLSIAGPSRPGLLGIAALLFASGCVQIPREAGFGDVKDAVSGRIGQRVHWYQGTAEDQQVAEAVSEMLADGLTVEESVQIALLNNRRLQGRYEDLGLAQAMVVQAGLLRNPIFDAAVAFSTQGMQSEYDVSLGLDFLQFLYIPLRKAVAQADFEAAKLHVTGAVIDHAAQTRTAFYRAQADQQTIEMRQHVMQAISASYELAQRLHKAGNIHDLDLAIQRSMFEQAKLDLAAADAAVLISREGLNRLMGLWGDDVQWTITGRLPEVPDERMELADLEQRAIGSSVDLAIERQELVVLAQQLGLTKAMALVPSLEAGPTAEHEDSEWVVGPFISLALPIFDQGQARIAMAASDIRRQRQAFIASAIELRSVARQARTQLLMARRSALHYRNVLLPLRESIVDETLLQYNAMQLGPFRLLLAREQQITTAARYIEALHDYWVVRNQLDTLLAGRMADGPRMRISPSFTMQPENGGH